MDDPTFNLLISLTLIPIVIWLHIWIRKRKRIRRNESGQEEFGSLGSTLISTLGEGLALITSLILTIWVMGAILRYIFPAIFGTRL
ncbi:MAG: hypothetical protein E2O81_05080 [Betaproteobacteria bacterium]|nr:MAG: hypothetical protein E2O81_05080 [Betaproteobacteria bacterium]